MNPNINMIDCQVWLHCVIPIQVVPYGLKRINLYCKIESKDGIRKIWFEVMHDDTKYADGYEIMLMLTYMRCSTVLSYLELRQIVEDLRRYAIAALDSQQMKLSKENH